MEGTLDAEKSFTYPFDDPEWISKLGLGALISLVPVLNLAWSGYLVGIIRNVMKHNPGPLPTWDDPGKKFIDGLILFAAGLVYALPILVVLLLAFGVAAFSGSSLGNSELQEFGRALTEAGGALLLCLLCVFSLYGIVFAILYPAILVLFAREGTFASCFKLRDAFVMIRKNAALFFTAWGWNLVASLGVGLIVGFINLVVGWVPCIGWIIGVALSLGSGIYLTAVRAHLFGQFGRATFEQNQLLMIP